VLNEFPLTEVIFHPRIAKQMYEGDVIDSAFQFAENHLKHKLVYNGDIFSVDDFKNKQQLFPQTARWMLGRGILMNPLLPAEINNIEIPAKVKAEKLREFHNLIFKYYSDTMDNQGNVLNKMKQFWIYFSFNFTNKHKVLKTIKKINNLSRYSSEVQKIIGIF
jgi:tRNA-dihydrouridine synthase